VWLADGGEGNEALDVVVLGLYEFLHDGCRFDTLLFSLLWSVQTKDGDALTDGVVLVL
jgi:hypothetical protein